MGGQKRKRITKRKRSRIGAGTDRSELSSSSSSYSSSFPPTDTASWSNGSRHLDHNQKIKVKMDLSGPADHKQTGKKDAPPGNYISGKQTTYEDPWCEVRLPLIDGTTAIVEFDVVWHRLDVKKRGSRGKIKFKTKWRKECVARATLLPPESITWNESSLRDRADSRLEKVKMVDKDGVTCARLERWWAFKNAGDVPSDAPPAREVVGLLLRLHSAMIPPPEVRS